MPRPTPTSTETTFAFEELFFSKTDPAGRIQFGNDVFVRVSGYTESRLIGAPHSLVRHPDMPRSVFKLFWGRLTAGLPVAAYVKNMTERGDYYWVLAVACPIPGGFLSIRLRPSSPLFDAARDLYAGLLASERTAGLDEVHATIEARLRELGFAGYEEFMGRALRAELVARVRAIESVPRESDPSTARYADVERVTREGSRQFDQLFEFVDVLARTNEAFSKGTAAVLDRFATLGYLSVNMMVSADKFGSAAATLSVISGEFRRRADVIEGRVRSFGIAAGDVSTGIGRASFNLSAMKLQMEMVEFFVRESVATGAFEAINANRTDFLALAESSARDLDDSLTALAAKIRGCANEVAAIRTFVSGLDMIRLTGQVEAARDEGIQAAFVNQLEGLNAFTDELRTAVGEFEEHLTTLASGTASVLAALGEGRTVLTRVFAAVPTANAAAA